MPRTPPSPIPCLELYSGIGGFASAAGAMADVRCAMDLSPHVVAIYRHNFPGHGVRQVNLEFVRPEALARHGAQMWWLSPPCQPFTTRGNQLDLGDARSRSFLHILDIIAQQGPAHLAMENVPGFVGSEAHTRMSDVLRAAGYEVRERVLCPTSLGIPARRERYYLSASREGLRPLPAPTAAPKMRRIGEFLEDESLVPAELVVTEAFLEQYELGIRILDPIEAPEGIANTFTGAYGKSWRASGSYLRMGDGRVRRFTPREMLRVMGFPESFTFPADTPLRHRYKAIGNSLSVWSVREVLADLPCFPTAS